MKEVWEMSRDEWLSQPREWEMKPRELTVQEWRASHGYHNPLDDHGDFRFPNGLSKAAIKRRDQRWADRFASMNKGSGLYEAAKARGEVPLVVDHRHISADGTDSEQQLAQARVYHRTEVKKAIRAGKPVPLHVLADYPQLPGKGIQGHFDFRLSPEGEAA